MRSKPPKGARPPYPPARPPQNLIPPARPPQRTGPPAAPRARAAPSRRAPRGGKPTALKVLVFLIFGSLTMAAVLGFVTVVGGAVVYSRGLPAPTELETIVFPEDTVIYARDGQQVLARISASGERRRVIRWEDVPPILADAVTAVEDKTFWANTGIDPLGIASAAIDTLTGDARGGSTITQQLVRQKLLPDDVMQASTRLGERKIKELIQSIRVTDAYRGREGKAAILTAYLNQNFYGNNSYGVQAAAKSYFGIADLDDLTIAQAATLAAIPQAPSTYDLVRNAVETDDGRLIVPADSAIVRRRNLVLDLLANDATRRELTGDTYSRDDFLAAREEELVLVPQGQPAWRAPHFVWYVRDELRQRLCGDAESCDTLDQGGLRVVTTLDWRIQQSAEKWIQAATLVPHRADPAAAAQELGVSYAAWMQRLRNQNVWNGALSAIDYERGEIIAYVGSANYYERRKVSRKMQPQFDVLSSGWRQPGSAFKPFTYATGIDERSLTAATMLMDVTTDFGGGYAPTDFNGQERGPVRVRNALQFSLNIPAVKALALVGEADVFGRAQDFGMQFQRQRPTAGLAMALGTLEVHPLDLNQAYATLANGGGNSGHTSILSVTNTAGEEVLPRHTPPKGERAISEQAAYVVTDILAGNTDPGGQPHLGGAPHHGQERSATPGGPEDRHHQRRQGPQRLRLHRDTLRGGAQARRVRPLGGCLGRQQRFQPGHHGGQPGVLPGRGCAHLGCLPERGDAELGDPGLRTAQRPDDGAGRCLHRAPALAVVASPGERALPARYDPGSRSLSPWRGGRPRSGRQAVSLGGRL